MPSENANFIVFAHGRGRSHAFMITGETQEVANRCKILTDCGFEAYVYKIEPSLHGNVPYQPQGSVHLRRVYHLWDAHDKYRDEIHSIIEGLSTHSADASKEYIVEMIEALNKELSELTSDYPGNKREALVPDEPIKEAIE